MTADEVRAELQAAEQDLARVLTPDGRIVSLERLRERQAICARWVAMYRRELAETEAA